MSKSAEAEKPLTELLAEAGYGDVPANVPAKVPNVEAVQTVKVGSNKSPAEAAVPPGLALYRMNDKHAVIVNLGGSGKCVVMEYKPSRINPEWSEPSYQTFASFRERYSNRYVQTVANSDKGKAVITSVGAEPMGGWWLKQPGRHEYEDVDLVPNGPKVLPGNRHNLWDGYAIKPREGDWSPLQTHLNEVLAGGDPKSADYILRYSAWKLQHPGERPEVALVFRGKKGTGKGLWMTTLLKIFGGHGVHIHNTQHLTGKHNKHLQNKLIVCADEAVWGGDRDAERVLKGMITDPTIMIEPKGIDAFEWPNRMGVIMSANEKWVVPATEDERRYAVFGVSPVHMQDPAYFVPLFNAIDQGDVVAAMLHDLLQLNLDGWHPRYNIPQTPALLEQKMLSLEGMDQWWFSKLHTGQTPPPARKSNPRHIVSKELLKECKEFSPKNYYLNETEFGLFMGKLGCEHKSTGANWGWVLKPLPEMRADFELRFGMKIDWLEPNIVEWNEKPRAGHS